MDLVSSICNLLDLYDLAPGLLELEITESAAMASPENVILLLNSLRELGLQLAIDDFGTGYSSLSYLRRLPVHALKIDRSFIQDVGKDGGAEMIIRTTINLAHQLGMIVVAEGVETEAQRSFLLHSECDQIQGYLVGRPQAAPSLRLPLASLVA